MLPSILAKQLEKGLVDYIDTTFPMTNDPFKGSLKNCSLPRAQSIMIHI